ncbi:MAG TPA: ABC transporter substrate-binding protein [Acidimicrobiales bacterium]|nr:ABC transporter substrate-binding protein [Acidimicrobiales bacterium]
MAVPRAGAAGALTVGETPGAPPTSIFPLEGCAQDTLANVQQFQDLLYRPLYWYGLSGSPGYQAALSPATTPTTNRATTQVSFTMRGWRFADGRPVDGTSVLFFLNLVQADPSAFCNAVPVRGVPSGLRAVRVQGNLVTLTFSTRVNLDWLMGNDLSNVVPLDPAWSRSATGPDPTCANGTYGAARTLAACRQVLSYLQGLGTTTSGFASGFWQGGVDGPWLLRAFDASGDATLSANPRYSGPVRARVGALRLVAFPSYAAEEDALARGTLDVGTVPGSAIPAGSANVPTLASRDTLYATPFWGFDGIEVNFAATGAGGPLVAQGYLRGALEQAIDQKSLVATVFNGRAAGGASPIPPSTPASLAKVTGPFPSDPAAARRALTSHGWSLAGPAATCTDPGTGASQCGPGVAQGQTLALSLVVASGDPALNQELSLVKVAWAALGVSLTVTFDTATNVAADCASATTTDLCWSGQGWSYLSDYYPSGDPFYSTTAAASLGGFATPVLAHWLALVEIRRGELSGYGTYMAQSLPVLYLPTPDTLWEVSTGLASAHPLRPCPTGVLTPEFWYFT